MAFQEQYKGYSIYKYTRRSAEDELIRFIKECSNASLEGMIREYVYPYPHIVRIIGEDDGKSSS